MWILKGGLPRHGPMMHFSIWVSRLSYLHTLTLPCFNNYTLFLQSDKRVSLSNSKSEHPCGNPPLTLPGIFSGLTSLWNPMHPHLDQDSQWTGLTRHKSLPTLQIMLLQIFITKYVVAAPLSTLKMMFQPRTWAFIRLKERQLN